MKIRYHPYLLLVCFLLAASCVKRIEPGLSEPEVAQKIPPPPTGDSKDSPIFLTWEGLPEVVYSVDPEYPKEALEDSVAGLVLLEVIIDESGKVLSAEVVQSKPPGLFDEAAIAVVMKREYKPLPQRDVPGKIPITQLVVFMLKKKRDN